jgi:hypothetical protein
MPVGLLKYIPSPRYERRRVDALSALERRRYASRASLKGFARQSGIIRSTITRKGNGMGFWGAMIMSFFGTAFAIAGVVQLDGGRSPFLAIPVAVFVAFVAYALRAYRSISARGRIRPLSPRAEKVVRWSSFGEGIGILVAVNVANNVGHPELKLAAIAFVVGLHFLPMADAIPFRPFYVLGAALVVTSIVGMYMPQPQGSAFAVFMACAGLWTAALFAMQREMRSAPVVAAGS